MIIYIGSFGGGPWWAGPLLMLTMTAVFDGGLISGLFRLFSPVSTSGNYVMVRDVSCCLFEKFANLMVADLLHAQDFWASDWWEDEPVVARPGARSAGSHGQRPQQHAAEGDGFWIDLASFLVPLVLSAVMFKLMERRAARVGGWANVFPGLFGAPAAAAGGARRAPQQPRQRATVDQIAAALQKLPTEAHCTQVRLARILLYCGLQCICSTQRFLALNFTSKSVKLRASFADWLQRTVTFP